MKAHSFLPGFVLLLFLVACGGEKDEKEQNVSQVLKSEDPTVDVMVLHRGDFLRELIANGNVVAARKADLRFSSAEPITDIYVSNGDRVKKGQKLAVSRLSVGSLAACESNEKERNGTVLS